MRRKKSEGGTKWAVGLCALLVMTGSAVGATTGQWDFTTGLGATTGADLQASDAGVLGATSFNKTSAYGIPAIVPTDSAGNPTGPAVNADVMSFPETAGGTGYKMWPGAAANGGGSYVNQYTLVMDVYFLPVPDDRYRALFQTGGSNTNDGDFFVGDLAHGHGIGISGSYHGTIDAGNWYRIALVVDLTQPTNFLKYINGQFVGSQTVSGGVDGRFSVNPSVGTNPPTGDPSWILSDEDGETGAGYADMVLFYDTALSGNDIAALGGIKNVPEPASLALLGLGAAALLRRRARA